MLTYFLFFSDTDEEELNRLAEAAVSGYSIIQKGEGNVLIFLPSGSSYWDS